MVPDTGTAIDREASVAWGSLHGGLVASCQPVRGGHFDAPCFVEAFALAALEQGAVALRLEGLRDLAWIRPRVQAPIVGLIKRGTSDPDVFITPTLDDAQALVEHGADIVAFDGTNGSQGGDREGHVATFIDYVHHLGRAVMADVSTIAEGVRAAHLGADFVATTLAGFTTATRARALPDLALVRALAESGVPTVAEGALSEPRHVAEAFAVGAIAVTVGTAFSRPEVLVGRLVAATPRGCDRG